MPEDWRIGIGFDLHPVVSDRPLRLGGITIECDFGLGGHTDGDVVLHALIDALFGAAGLTDIGEHFPDSDAAWAGQDSRELLTLARQEVFSNGWQVNNVDLIILAEYPRLSEYKDQIRQVVAELLEVSVERVGVKAKTNEGFDAIGRRQAIACQVVVTLRRGES